VKKFALGARLNKAALVRPVSSTSPGREGSGFPRELKINRTQREVCMSKLVISALIVLTMIFGPLAALAAELKIGIADTNSILMNSAEGKRIQESIKKKADELSRPLGVKRQDLTRQVEEFQKQASLMKEDARKAKSQELEKKMAEFDKEATDADKQLAQFRQSQFAPLSQKMNQALEKVSQQEKLDLILDKSTVLISNKNMDVTDKLRSAFGQ
jgi:outer membrane protein